MIPGNLFIRIILASATVYLGVIDTLYFYSLSAVPNVFPKEYYVFDGIVLLPLLLIVFSSLLFLNWKWGVRLVFLTLILLLYTHWNLTLIELKDISDPTKTCSSLLICHTAIITSIPVTIIYTWVFVRMSIREYSVIRKKD